MRHFGWAAWPMPRGRAGRSAVQEAAKSLGIHSTTTMKRLRRAMQLYGLAPVGIAPNLPDPPSTKGNVARRVQQQTRHDDLALTALRDEVRQLKSRLRDQNREDLAAEAMDRIVGRLVDTPLDPPKWLSHSAEGGGAVLEVPVTIWSDWHGGERVSAEEVNGVNAFDTSILERRVQRLTERTIDLLKNHGPGHYPGIVVNLLGDFISGALHPELAKTDEEEVLPSTLRVIEILIAALDMMISAFGMVYCPCAAGNHGRITQKPEFKRYSYKNFDWFIYRMLARHYSGNDAIRFDIRPDNQVLYRVHGQRYMAMHGDMLGVKGGDGIIGAIGPIMRGEVKVGKQSAAIGQDYDVLLMGHWHQQLWLPRIIVANTLKGFDEYARNALRAPPSPPSQPLWLVHPRWGRTMHRDVFLEDPGLPSTGDWVGWQVDA